MSITDDHRAAVLVAKHSGDPDYWREFANCLGANPDLFFPDRGVSTKEAKQTCQDCIVREDCLAFALANCERFGIWGGLSERQRRRMRRQNSPRPR
ncbi:WhiB family transcriptional regulator [bacterium]|nr:MAG: WhiB family transcriptional regulator [bacterium]